MEKDEQYILIIFSIPFQAVFGLGLEYTIKKAINLVWKQYWIVSKGVSSKQNAIFFNGNIQGKNAPIIRTSKMKF